MSELKSTSRFKHALMASALTLGMVGSIAAGSALLPEYANANTSSHAVATTAAFSFADMVEAAKPAVVSVKVAGKPGPSLVMNDDTPRNRFFKRFGRQGDGMRPRPRRQSQGSGFFISSDGYLVTNHHVIDKGDEFEVQLIDGTSYNAKLIGSDAKTDLALLKVDADATFSTVSFAEDVPRIGDWVVAVGNPFGLGGTVTAGIVSAHGREIGASVYDDFIQIDAPVNRGNSGGPSFNARGEVIGVNTAIFSPSGGNVGIAFAIPAETAKLVIEDLKQDGVVERGWLGVQIQSLSEDLASALGLESTDGAMITSITDNGPAARGGLKVGDVILNVNGEVIEDPKDLARTIGNIAPGKDADVSIWRDGEKDIIALELGLQDAPQKTANVDQKSEPAENQKRLGLQIAPNRDGEGAMIAGIEPNSPAADKGLRRGQRILSVNGTNVSSPEEIIAVVREAKDAGKASVILQLETPRGPRFVAVPFAQG